jgi:hypothetical protein
VLTLHLRPRKTLAHSRETSVEVEAAEAHFEDHRERAGAAREAAAVTRIGVAIISKTLVATSSKTGTKIHSSKIILVMINLTELSLALLDLYCGRWW